MRHPLDDGDVRFYIPRLTGGGSWDNVGGMPNKTQRESAAGRNEVFVTLRLPASLYDDLCRLAKGRFRTATDEARLALHDHVLKVNGDSGKGKQ